MKTRSPKHRAGVIALLPLLLLASACAERVTAVQTFPPNADLEAATEAKPKPTPDIVTDPQAEARYNVSVELWGERVRAAGVRICNWAKEMGAAVDCPL